MSLDQDGFQWRPGAKRSTRVRGEAINLIEKTK